MKIALGFSPINWMLFAVGAALSLFVLQMLPASRAVIVSAPAAQVSEATLAKVTEGLLRQTALHLSKMQRGASVGGFPGFEPPDDDKEYRDKVKNERYTPQDVNDWVKHKKLDEDREAREKAEEEVVALRMAAMDKLTPEERRVLGLDR
mgnify:CR=1 FL=1